MRASDVTSCPPIAGALLGWYDRHARKLPWRAAPGAEPADPYRVWLSEVMLQQTTVAAVIPYFERFTSAWPDVAALAAADEGAVMAAWAGLGYYARARNLLACARAVAARGGTFPDTEEGLRALPGVGAYTAAAVAAIAFRQRAVVVDANVERVVSRLFAVDRPLPGSRPEIRRLTDGITPDARAGDFAQAMMDLGSSVCTPRSPQCGICPLTAHCAARAGGTPEAYPRKAPRKAKPLRKGTAFWIERGGTVWLVRRPGHGMLGGMLALPDDGWSAQGDGSGAAPIKADWQNAGQVSHVFTHFALDLAVLRAEVGEGPLPEAGAWHPAADIEAAGLPTLFAKAARLARAAGEN